MMLQKSKSDIITYRNLNTFVPVLYKFRMSSPDYVGQDSHEITGAHDALCSSALGFNSCIFKFNFINVIIVDKSII